MLLLDSERTIAAALAVRAIADSWDTGRIGPEPRDPATLPREREVLGLLGMTRGLAAQRLAKSSESLRDLMTQHADIERSVPGLQPLQEIVDEFSLSQLGRTLLML